MNIHSEIKTVNSLTSVHVRFLPPLELQKYSISRAFLILESCTVSLRRKDQESKNTYTYTCVYTYTQKTLISLAV